MHPAFSVIIFTTLSGAGYGLFGLTCIALLSGYNYHPEDTAAFVFISGLLATIGLISSLFHLGHPKRAWRAFSQWRTSWLSREGCLAVLINSPMGILFFGAWVELSPTMVTITATIGLALSAATVFATSMIYRSIKAIPAWANNFVPISYMLLAAASGLIMFRSISAGLGGVTSGISSNTQLLTVIMLACIIVKFLYWRRIDTLLPPETIQSATGLSGNVKVFERPHSGENYLTKEMGFRAERETCLRRRHLAILLGFIAPSFIAISTHDTSAQILASIACLTGLCFERWLFFAEARHTTMLYYGDNMQSGEH